MGELIKIPTADMTHDQWLAARNIGGSDMPTIFGLNNFKPAAKLFYEKIGMFEENRPDNEATYGGRVAENLVATEYWRYYNPEEPTIEEIIKNSEANNIIRQPRRTNFLYYKSDTPHITANPDRLIPNNPYTPNGILEIKTALGFAIRKYENQLPPLYTLQPMTYMYTLDMDYAEVAVLVDGRFFDVYPIHRDEELIQIILKKANEFWERVLEGRKVMELEKDEVKRMQLLVAMEPPVEGTEAYESFLKEQYREINQLGSMVGNEQQEKDFIEYEKISQQIKSLEDSKQLFGNTVKNHFRVNEVDHIDFGARGIATYKVNAKGNPMLRLPKNFLLDDE